MSSHIVIAAGGTAGHVVPALAVADVLRDRGAQVTFVGTDDRAEADLVPAAGYELRCLKVRGLDRGNPLKAAKAMALAGAAIFPARAILKELGADAFLGGGGYVSAPVGIAAASLRLPIVLTEADSRLGIANRLLTTFAKRICLAFALEGRTSEKYLVTGRPVPAQTGRVDRGEAKRHYGIAEQELVLLIFGGSLGARTINEAALEAFTPNPAAAGSPLYVLHVCGRRDFAALSEQLSKLNAERYRLIDFVTPDFATLLAAADLVVARAGGSVFELAAAGKPALLIPYPHATADHQTRNAAWMVEAGAALKIADSELTGDSLKSEVDRLLGDSARIKEMAEASRALAMPDAADRVADEVLAALRSAS